MIIASQSDLREGLHSLLTVIPHIMCIALTGDASTALQIVEEQCPDLVVLDLDLPQHDVFTVLGRIKGRRPQSRCLVLADDTQQLNKAESVGADVAVLKGYPASKLVATMKMLLTKT